ncbi:hypothetical protein CLOP_g3005, partial [Closterium sp. NIES-67]
LKEHAEQLRQVFTQLRKHRLFVKQSKCEFAKASIPFLCHAISHNQLVMDPSKLKAVQDWTPPTSMKEVQAFLGLANYYCKFIRHFAAITSPLSNLLRKNEGFHRDSDQKKIFDSIKCALTSSPTLVLSDPSLPYVMWTDASHVAKGAILCQDQGHGLQPIAFEPRKLKPAECNYATHDREALAIVHAIKNPAYRKLRHLLLREHHDQNAHFGVDKTLAAISANFFWPKLSHDVRSYVHSSHMCQCNKARNTAPYCLLHPLEIPQVPWSHVALDFITDAPRTSSHYNAILTVVDKLRKMAHFLPTSTTVTAEHVADLFFKEVVRLHGIPCVLINDCDSRFVGRFCQSLFQRMDSKIRLSTAYHPQSDGQTERMNRTLENALRTCVNA